MPPPVKSRCPKCGAEGYTIEMHIGPTTFVTGKKVEIASKIKEVWTTQAGWVIHECEGKP